MFRGAYTLFELAKIEARNSHDSESAALSRRAYEIFKITLGEHNPDTEDARSMIEVMGDSAKVSPTRLRA